MFAHVPTSPAESCNKVSTTTVLPCQPGFVRAGANCVQQCWGALSKDCGAFCTRPDLPCTPVGE